MESLTSQQTSAKIPAVSSGGADLRGAVLRIPRDGSFAISFTPDAVEIAISAEAVAEIRASRYRGDQRLIGKLPGRPAGKRDIEHFAVINPHLPEWREELMALFPKTLSIYENQQHNHGGNENPPEPGTIEINTSPREPDQGAGNKDRGNREPTQMPMRRSREPAVLPRGRDLGCQEPDGGTPRAVHGDLGDLERTLEKLRRAREDAERVAGDLQILERARRHLRVVNELDQKVLMGNMLCLTKTTTAKRPGAKMGSRNPAPPVIPPTPTTPGEL